LDTLRAREGRIKRYPKKSIIYHEGEDSHYIYLILQGNVKLIKSNGKHEVITDIIYYDDCFGEVEVITKSHRICTAVARSSCSIKIITYDDFLYNLVSRNIISKFHNIVNHLSNMGLHDTYGKLAYILNTRKDENGIIHDRFTQQDLSDLIGSSREGVCLILRELVIGEFISYDENKQIVIRRKLPEKW